MNSLPLKVLVTRVLMLIVCGAIVGAGGILLTSFPSALTTRTSLSASVTQAFNSWYYLTPDGKLYAWKSGTKDLSHDTFVAQLSSAVYADPALLHEAIPDTAAASQLSSLYASYAFIPHSESYAYNWSGTANEKWIKTENTAKASSDGAVGGWYYLKPDGGLYVWKSGTKDLSQDIRIAQLHSKVYDMPKYLHSAELATSAGIATSLDQEYQFSSTGSYVTNWSGIAQEKWLKALAPGTTLTEDATDTGSTGTGGTSTTATSAPRALFPIGAYHWIRTASPALLSSDDGWDSSTAASPRFAKRTDGSLYRDAEGNYYLYYAGSSKNSNDYDETGLALSKDLKIWTKYSPQTAPFPLGPRGGPDGGDVQVGTVIHDGGLFHMWYTGNRVAPGVYATDDDTIVYATSSDGKVWNRYHGNPILVQGQGADAGDLYDPLVIKDGTVWKMWYMGHNADGNLGLMHATAQRPEGPWTKYSQSYLWDKGDTLFLVSDVWKENGTYFAIYSPLKDDAFSLHYATSPDGIMWTERRELLAGASGNEWDRTSLYNGTHATVDGVIYLWYNANPYEKWGGSGYATGYLDSYVPLVASLKQAFVQESITLRFSGSPAKSGAWIGLYASPSAKNNEYKDWRWTDNTKTGLGQPTVQGNVSFPKGSVRAGSYQARLIFDGQTLATTTVFTVN